MTRALLVAVVVGICLLSRTVLAEELSWELSALTSQAEHDPYLDADHTSVQATYYFQPVDDSNGPYELASFLNPATRVHAVLSREKQTSAAFDGGPPPSVTIPERVTTTEQYSLGGRYLLRPSKWYFGGSYTASDVGNSPPLFVAEDASSYGLLAGKYLGAATTLEVTFDSSDFRSEREFVFCVTQGCVNAGTLTSETRRDRGSLNFLHVRRSRLMTYSLSARIAASSGNLTVHIPAVTLPGLPAVSPFLGPVGAVTLPSITEQISIPRLRSYSFAGQVFPTAKLGVRVGYSRWDDDTPADDAYNVATTWFVTRNVGVEFALSRQTIDDTQNASVFTDGDFRNLDTAAIGVTGRF
jgi:hypothetical protein